MSATTDQGRPQLRQSRHQRMVNGERLEDFGARRTCTAPDCGTVLSRYNPSATCTVHAGWRDTRQRSHA